MAGQGMSDGSVFFFVAGDEGEAGIEIAVGDGDSGVGRRGDGGGDAGDDFKGNMRRRQGETFFSAAAEDEWIAALQADNAFAELGLLDEQGVDFVLGHGVVGGAFTDVDDLRRVKMLETGLARAS